MSVKIPPVLTNDSSEVLNGVLFLRYNSSSAPKEKGNLLSELEISFVQFSLHLKTPSPTLKENCTPKS